MMSFQTVRGAAAIVLVAGGLAALSCQTASAPPPSGESREPTPESSPAPEPTNRTTSSPAPEPTGTPASSAVPEPTGAPGSTPPPEPTGAPTPPPKPTTETNPEEQAAGEQAKRQLSRDKGIPLAQIQVVQVDKVDWPDTSLGCPQPGMMYAQVITPGYKVLLTANGVTYEYHTQGTERAVACTR